MIIQGTVDPTPVLEALGDLAEKQAPYAVSLALNRTANAAQKAEREHIRSVFRLRRESYVLKGIYISKADRATKSSRVVTIQVLPDRDYLERMEEGGSKWPTKGRWIWKPNPKVFPGIIGRSNPLNPHNLKFDANWHGNERTFMIKPKAGGHDGPLVLQRINALKGREGTLRDDKGRYRKDEARAKALRRARHRHRKSTGRRGNGETRMLYMLVSRTTVPAKLQFVSVIKNTVMAEWPKQVAIAAAEAIQTARV